MSYIISDELLFCNIFIKRIYFELNEMDKQSFWYLDPDQLIEK